MRRFVLDGDCLSHRASLPLLIRCGVESLYGHLCPAADKHKMKPRLILLAQCICTISILVVACEPATSTSASEPNPTITLPTTLTSLPNPVTNAISTPGHGSVVQAPPPILTTTPTITLVSDRCLPAEATGIIASGGIVLYDHNNFSLIIKGRSELRIPEQPTLDSYTRKVFLTPSDTYLGYDLVNQDNYDLVIRESNGSIYKDYPEAVYSG